MRCLMRIVGLMGGMRTIHDGQFVQEYDPNRNDESDRPHTVYLTTTLNLLEAKKFDNVAAALEFWKLTDERCPLRPDGEPNRPLTAFSVEVVDMDHLP